MSDELQKLLAEHFDKVIKEMTLETKIEEYFDKYNTKTKVTWYWDNTACSWVLKERAIKSKLISTITPLIDETIENNDDFIKFFL